MNKDVFWLVFVLIIIGVLFSFQKNQIGIFKGPPSSGQQPAPAPASQTPPPVPTAPSGPSGNDPALRISSALATSNSAAAEYIVLENVDYATKSKVNISGLRLQNRDNISAAIGRDENNNNISLDYGERALVATGESPLGKNFKINKCSGYFNQQNSFSPSIFSSCPSISNLPLPKNLNNRCVDYIESLPGCIMPNINADTGIDNTCVEFVTQHASYAGCVADHKNDSDFDQHEWRVYLGKNSEMWGNKHELIQLFDQLWKLITEISY